MLNIIKNYKGQIKMPIFLDLEDETTSYLSKEELTNQAKTFCQIVKEAGFNSRNLCK